MGREHPRAKSATQSLFASIESVAGRATEMRTGANRREVLRLS